MQYIEPHYVLRLTKERVIIGFHMTTKEWAVSDNLRDKNDSSGELPVLFYMQASLYCNYPLQDKVRLHLHCYSQGGGSLTSSETKNE
jgi:hypothetical protein